MLFKKLVERSVKYVPFQCWWYLSWQNKTVLPNPCCHENLE
jgi:hypothetical protein